MDVLMNKTSGNNLSHHQVQAHHQSHFTTRPIVNSREGNNMIMINKENKFQNLLAAVELNRTSNQEQRRHQGGGHHHVSKDHYQSHREFGRDLSNNGVPNSQHQNPQIINAKIINHTGTVNTTTNQGSGSNISLFKNFITQYQSHSNSNAPKGGNSTLLANNTGNLSKLDLNKINTSNQQLGHNGNFPSQRGLNQNNNSINQHHHSAVLQEQEGRAASSQGALKTFDHGSRNSHQPQGQQSQQQQTIAQMNSQIREQLRNKHNNVSGTSNNARRNGVGIGDEFRRVGQQLTEMPKTKDQDKSGQFNTSIVNNNGNPPVHSIHIPTKSNNATTIISRTAAAQQMIHQKSLNTSKANGMNNANTQRTSAYNTNATISQAQSLQSSQIHYKLLQTKQNFQNSHIEDKENKREFTNRQNTGVPGTVASASNLLKRSKTTDPSRAPLRQKEGAQIPQDKNPQPQASSSTLSTVQTDSVPSKPLLSEETFELVAKIMEDRRKERMKTLTRNLEVCDLLDMRNPQSVAEFAPQIYKNMHIEEVQHLYPKDFMANQQEITEKMRAYLIDWLTELHIKFKLWPETLFVCVGIIDKFLMVEPDFKKKDLQSLGLTALHIAGKYEEIYPPELKNLLRVTDNAVSKDQILKLEFRILQLLDFNLTFPSINRFMERYCRIAQVNERTQMLAAYLCESCLLDCTLMKEKPSKLAAVSLYAAQRVMKGTQATVWNATLTKNTSYKEEEVRGMAIDLLQFIKNVEGSSLQSIFKKYSSAKFLEVAKLLE